MNPLRPRPTLIVLAAVALATRLGATLHDPLWFDEVNTLYRADTDGVLGVIAHVAQDVQAPLYDLLVHALGRVLPGPLAVRLPALVAGVLLVPVIYGLARRLRLGRRVATCAAVWVALQPFLVRMGSEGRPYALLALLVTLAWDAVVRVRQSRGRAGLGRLAIMMTLVVTCHYYGILAVAAMALVLFASPNRLGTTWPRVVTALAVPLLALLAWSPAALYQFHLKQLNAIYRPLFAWSTVRDLLDAHGWFGGTEPTSWAWVSRLVLVALVVVGMCVHRRRARGADRAGVPVSCVRPALGFVLLGLVLLGASHESARAGLASLAATLYKGGRPLDADNLAFLGDVRTLMRVEGALMLAIAILVAALPAITRTWTMRLGTRGLLLIGLLAPLVATALLEVTGKHTLLTRSTIILSPLLALAGSRGLLVLRPGLRAGVITLLACLTLFSPADTGVYQPRPDWRAVVALASDTGAQVVTYPPWLARCMDYHRGLAWGTTFGSWRPGDVADWAHGRSPVLLVRSFEPLHPPDEIRSVLVRAFGPPKSRQRIGRITCELFDDGRGVRANGRIEDAPRR